MHVVHVTDTSTTRTVTEEHQEYDEYLEPRFPDGKGPVTFASQSDVRRSNSRLLPEEPGAIRFEHVS